MSKSTEELQQEIRAIIKSPMKSKVSTADIAVGMMSSTALSEKVIQLSGLFDQELVLKNAEIAFLKDRYRMERNKVKLLQSEISKRAKEKKQ